MSGGCAKEGEDHIGLPVVVLGKLFCFSSSDFLVVKEGAGYLGKFLSTLSHPKVPGVVDHIERYIFGYMT